MEPLPNRGVNTVSKIMPDDVGYHFFPGTRLVARTLPTEEALLSARAS
jgi:hypothetical protein